jgi:hypothetical protein
VTADTLAELQRKLEEVKRCLRIARTTPGHGVVVNEDLDEAIADLDRDLRALYLDAIRQELRAVGA